MKKIYPVFLGLNETKTHYLLINKQPRKSCNLDFKIFLNKVVINKAFTVKHLRVFIDKKLNWDSHVQNLSLHLARFLVCFVKFASTF